MTDRSLPFSFWTLTLWYLSYIFILLTFDLFVVKELTVIYFSTPPFIVLSSKQRQRFIFVSRSWTLYEGRSSSFVMNCFQYTRRMYMYSLLYLEICRRIILSYIDQWYLKEIEHNTLLYSFKVVTVLYNGIYSKVKRGKNVEIRGINFHKKRRYNVKISDLKRGCRTNVWV